MSLVPLLKREGRLKRDAIYWHYPHYGNQGGSPGSAMRQGDWKLIEFAEDNRVELYNLREDIGETRNLAADVTGHVAAMRRQLHNWQSEVGAKFPSPNTKPKRPAAQDSKAGKNPAGSKSP